MTPRLITFSAAVLCAILGFAGGYIADPPSSAASAPTSSTAALSNSATPPDLAGTASERSARKTSKNAPLRPGKPPTSLKEILAYPSQLHAMGAAKAWFDQMPVTQFPAMLTELLSLPSEDRGETLHMLFLAWAERAPTDGAKFLTKLPANWQRSDITALFYTTWGQSDLEQARSWCEKNLTGIERYQALRINADKPETLEAILASRDPQVIRQALSGYFAKKALLNRTEALDEAIRLPNSRMRINAIYPILEAWVESDPAAAIRWMKAQPSGEQSWMSELSGPRMISALIRKDPLMAKAYIAELPAGRRSMNYVDQVAAKLAEDNLPAALAYFEEIKAQDPNKIPNEFFSAWLAADPAAASARLRAEVLSVYPGDKLAQEEGRIGKAMADWMLKDPAAAAQFSTTLPEGAQRRLFRQISQSWMRQDGAGALSWAQSLPAGQTKNEAMREFAANLSRHDTTQSTQWLEALPQNSARWAATEGVAASTFDNNPEAALTLVRSISDESERIRVLERTWKKWAEQNKSSADDWLKNAALSEAERKALAPPPPAPPPPK